VALFQQPLALKTYLIISCFAKVISLRELNHLVQRLDFGFQLRNSVLAHQQHLLEPQILRVCFVYNLYDTYFEQSCLILDTPISARTLRTFKCMYDKNSNAY